MIEENEKIEADFGTIEHSNIQNLAVEGKKTDSKEKKRQLFAHKTPPTIDLVDHTKLSFGKSVINA